MIDLSMASFHYSLAHLNLKSESIFYDHEAQLYRNCPKQTSTSKMQKLSVHEIIRQSRKLCTCDDPQQFNLMLTEPFLKKFSKLTKRVERRLSQGSIICLIFNRIFNWFKYRVFATTTEVMLQTRQTFERHMYYLVGKKLSFTIM